MSRKKSLRKKISHLAGKISLWRKPHCLIKFVIKSYVWFYHINLDEYDFAIKKGISFHEFFTRRFKQGARVINEGIISPVDAKIMSYGIAGEGTMIRAKGLDFVFGELIACEHPDYSDVSYTVLYLSPADYHRIHAPFNMNIDEVRHVPGNLFSVKPKSVKNREKLYSINERVILEGDSDYGRFWMVLIGAFLVGSVKLNFSSVTTNQGHCKKKTSLQKPSISFNAGDEIGHFRFGSTVVICMQGSLLAQINRPKSTRVQMGEKLIKNLV